MPDSSDGRVTLAVLQNEIRHLGEKMDEHYARLCSEVGEVKAEHRDDMKDHEDRLRTLEGANRQGLWRDIGVFLAAVTAGITSWLAGKGGP